MTKAYRLHRTGGPEVLSFDEVEVGAPGPGEVRLKQTAVGLNYIDVYHRTGLYPLELPSGIGLEAAGVVEAVGEGVTGFTPGDRVAYAGPPIGAYAEARLIPAKAIVKLPDSIDDIQAAGMMLQGMTVEYLIHRTYPVKAGDTVLFHAAAGGVGLIACQWLKQLGATVIGTAGSEEKAALAKAHGADHVILYKQEDIAKRVREITDGAGVPVVYDSVGKDTFEASLDSLSVRGMMVSFGNASGPVPPFDPGILSAKGSLYFTRPSLMAYIAKHDEMLTAADRLFTAVDKGLSINVNQTYPLSEAAEAHRALEARETTGSTVFTV
ncbi:quinone oxidoreductase family protein [Aestuariispira insulae]|uniref:NADPH:quinone reductase-like Zn-dependent oxidoreductase n=1 Tax=Aestuariispira insulae TaxID=1461337 RepID=A0A3D9HPH2_9PROT|nr:quinone oxidoreductase [Aestuariispira insulae]RED51359.1 NADPH:quinone reductase-like Zn-dependent oxidoreductase [Aestuariispira insulae]